MDAQGNLAEYIDFARNQLPPFGHSPWSSNAWTRDRRSAGNGGIDTVGWTRKGSSSRRRTPQYMDAPLVECFKAHLIQELSKNPKLMLTTGMRAYRVLYEALIQAGVHDFTMVKAAHVNAATAYAQEHYAQSSAYRTGTYLEKLVVDLNKMGILTSPFQWTNPISRLRNASFGEEAEMRAKEKLPSDRVFEAIAAAYNNAKTPYEIYITSVVTFLAFSHMRISEAYRIDANDCERSKTEIDPDTGEKKEYWGVVFDPSKSDQSIIKWYPHSVVPLCRDALHRIIETSRDAREHFALYESGDITQIIERIGHTVTGDGVSIREIKEKSAWIYKRMSRKHKMSVHHSVSVQTISESLFELFPTFFPYAGDTDLKLSESIMVFMRHKWRANVVVYDAIPMLISQSSMANKLGSKGGAVRSIFDIAGPEYSDLKATSHQFRHAMSTILVEGGASELDIARNAGRFRIQDNDTYDHSQHSDLRKFIDESSDDDLLGQRVAVTQNRPITAGDIIEQRLDMSHLTEFGACDLSFSGSPCSYFRDCINCTHNICVKGDARAEQNLKDRLLIAERQLDRAGHKSADGHVGAGRWFEYHCRTVARMKELVALLNDPAVPLGTVLRANSDPQREPVQIAMQDQLDQAEQTLIDSLLG